MRIKQSSSSSDMSQQYFAHSTCSFEWLDWQPLSQHLLAVGEKAGHFAACFGGRSLGQVIGLLHDLGKYTLPFQERLRGSPQRVDHSTHGARVAQQRFGLPGQLLAYGIAGHHAGLANGEGEGERTALADRLRSAELPKLDQVWEHDITLPAKLDIPSGFKYYGETRQEAKDRQPFQLAFLTRMLFSCLVDADFIDTERFYRQANNEADYRSSGQPIASLETLRSQLDSYLRQFKADSDINQLRGEILRHVRHQAKQDPGLFSLTVPTGGGKTLASLAFALDHAIAHGLPACSVAPSRVSELKQSVGRLPEGRARSHPHGCVS